MADDEKKKKHRSPSYPAISLREAIERAKTIWAHETRHPVRLSVAAGHWKYSEKSSAARSTVAALVKFGLVEYTDATSGTFKLTQRALNILHGQEEVRAQAVKDAALAPKIYAELWSELGPVLPSDDSLRSKLLLDHAFNPNYITTFIRDFKGTIEFSKLKDSDKGVPDDGDGEESDEDPDESGFTPPPPPPPPGGNPPPAAGAGAGSGTVTVRTAPTGNMIAEISVPLAGNQLTLALVGTDPVLPDDIDDIDTLIDYLKKQLRKKVEREASRQAEQG